MYHLHFRFPESALIYSALLNGLRFAGFVWGDPCLWNGVYWLGSMLIAYYFITSFLILKLNPLLYMGVEAKSGNQVAIEQLLIIEAVQEKRSAYDEQQARQNAQKGLACAGGVNKVWFFIET
jgi:hypothetical protein